MDDNSLFCEKKLQCCYRELIYNKTSESYSAKFHSQTGDSPHRLTATLLSNSPSFPQSLRKALRGRVVVSNGNWGQRVTSGERAAGTTAAESGAGSVRRALPGGAGGRPITSTV